MVDESNEFYYNSFEKGLRENAFEIFCTENEEKCFIAERFNKI